MKYNATADLIADLREDGGYDFTAKIVEVDFDAAREDGGINAYIDLSGLSERALERWREMVDQGRLA